MFLVTSRIHQKFHDCLYNAFVISNTEMRDATILLMTTLLHSAFISKFRHCSFQDHKVLSRNIFSQNTITYETAKTVAQIYFAFETVKCKYLLHFELNYMTGVNG